MTVRYAVVGAGWISQIAFMPGTAQTTNSTMTAIVSGNAEAAARLAAFYGIDHVFPYDRYDEMLASDLVDAVYIALPNSLHADYAIRAARAGKHVLVEKPLAISVVECETMIDAANAAGVLLMTAYRLHNEPGTIEVLEQIRAGAIGDPRMFSSTFSFQAGADNHRLKAEHWGGPLQDIGIYCLNAVRHVFAAEPEQVWATRTHDTDPRFAEVEEMIAATLRFPGGRLAQFCVSFGAEDTDTYRITGTEGEITVENAYQFQNETCVRINRDGRIIEKRFLTDHFAGQTDYFSDCIAAGRSPEPDGAEGLADVRALLAIEDAARTGAAQRVDTPPRPGHPVPDMIRTYAPTDHRLVL